MMSGAVTHITSKLFLGLLAIILVLCVIMSYSTLHRREVQRVAKITEAHPDFDKFYKIWKKRRRRGP